MNFYSSWPIFILALAISIDGFTVGITYGIRKIKIGFIPLLIIGSISTIIVFLTSSLGAVFASNIPVEAAKIIGSLILIGIGIWIIYSTYQNYMEEKKEERELILSLKIKTFGIIINILKDPELADFDKSGTINYIEAVFLGLALALDAVGAGLGVGMTGLSTFFFPFVIGIVNILFVGAGVLFGEKLGDKLPDYFIIISGFIIICLGILNFF